MLDLTPPDYQYCPFCGTKLESKNDGEKERSFCLKDNWVYYPRMAVSCGAIIVEDGKILLTRRNREPYKGKWMLPSGFIEYGEHPEEAIKREVFEETGLRVTDLKLKQILQAVDDVREPGHYYIVYEAEVESGKLVNDELENQEVGWKEISEVNIDDMGFAAHKKVLEEIKNKK